MKIESFFNRIYISSVIKYNKTNNCFKLIYKSQNDEKYKILTLVTKSSCQTKQNLKYQDAKME